MPKIQLGGAPKTFKQKITFPLLGGGEGDLTVEFVYRTRAQFAAFLAGLYPDIKTGTAPDDTAPGFDLEAAADRELDTNVRHILGAVKGWDLEEPFDAVNVKKLTDEYPAASAAIVMAYRTALVEGRTKN
ncbi:phage tail assembly chaperone [Variovorax boronicumulans]|uniref:phage tail assembly chaperone n=1 Tax=Variovorax boronicumulans TaxID=436515 RepID=UPI001C594E45